jgi:two-component system, OmpR family, sensor kinase
MVLQRAELVERITEDAATLARQTAADELINVLAHDLRTPLTPLRGHLDLIRQRAAREGRDDYLHNATEAEAALHRLNRLVTTLLDAGRLDQGLFSLSGLPVNLADLARQSADLLRSPEHALHVHAPDEVCVTGDPDALHQVLENLLSNALQHSPAGVPVVVQLAQETRQDGEWAVLSVRDEGLGIAPTLLPTLFERFARGSASSGLGLGLYVARGIAQAHAGTLTVESEVGKGTTFRLDLPLMNGGS